MATSNPAAEASLALCESLILSLRENGVLSDREVEGLLEDAMNSHLNAAATAAEPELHREAAALIEAIRTGSTVLRGIVRKKN